MRLIIAGSANCVWDDLEKLITKRHWECTDDVMCINDMIMHFPGDIAHCVSCDAPMLSKWWAARRPPYRSRFNKKPRFHTVDNWQGVPNVKSWSFQGGGTSGLLAANIAVELGYEEIILCGIPIDNTPHYWQAHWEKCNFQREIADDMGRIRGDGRRYWINAAERFDGKVKSMSGYTKKLLGAP